MTTPSKILTAFVCFLVSSAPLQAAETATKLEGTFKVGPAVILIIILCVFIAVGLLNRAKGTADYWAAGLQYRPSMRSRWRAI